MFDHMHNTRKVVGTLILSPHEAQHLKSNVVLQSLQHAQQLKDSLIRISVQLLQQAKHLQ